MFSARLRPMTPKPTMPISQCCDVMPCCIKFTEFETGVQLPIRSRRPVHFKFTAVSCRNRRASAILPLTPLPNPGKSCFFQSPRLSSSRTMRESERERVPEISPRRRVNASPAQAGGLFPAFRCQTLPCQTSRAVSLSLCSAIV